MWKSILNGNRVPGIWRMPAAILAVVALAGAGPPPGAPPVRLALTRLGSVTLSGLKAAEQVVALNPGYAVRDISPEHPEDQALRIFDETGRAVRSLGGRGDEPGQFSWLMQVANGPGGLLWAADGIGRLNWFDRAGTLRGSTLVQNPGYRIQGMVLDPAHGVYYLSGCVPLHVYLDFGCHLVHQYRLSDRRYVRSFLETPQEAIANHFFGIESVEMDVDPQGRVFATDAPLHRVFRIEPASGKVEVLALRGAALRATRPLPRMRPREVTLAALKSSYLIDRVAVTGPFVVVSVQKPGDTGYLLEIIDFDGRPIATDLPSPGRLVGKAAGGALLFANRRPAGFELSRYRLAPPSGGTR
jgi:hypothetical protein